ncbi:MAG: response regulator [Candidatus Hadarchaeota archaeon]
MVKIIAVDDEPDILQLLERVFRKEGFEFIGFLDSAEFLKKYKKEKPDLVLLDLMMPKISGRDIYKKLKGMNKQQKVAFLTVLEPSPGETETYIEKPFEPGELVKKIRKIVGK